MKLVCNFGINDLCDQRKTSKEFRRYSDFKNWCQIGFGVAGFELDKDIIKKGNKEYHPNKCVFLPKEINSFLRTRKKYRGAHPIGVTTNCKIDGFFAFLKKDKKKVHLGIFTSPEVAFQAYKVAKEQAIKDMANKWRDQIDPRAYDVLVAYQVEIID